MGMQNQSWHSSFWSVEGPTAPWACIYHVPFELHFVHKMNFVNEINSFSPQNLVDKMHIYSALKRYVLSTTYSMVRGAKYWVIINKTQLPFELNMWIFRGNKIMMENISLSIWIYIDNLTGHVGCSIKLNVNDLMINALFCETFVIVLYWSELLMQRYRWT